MYFLFVGTKYSTIFAYTKTVKNTDMNTTATTYTTTEIIVKGNTWSVTIAKGQRNYVSIRKETNNPYKTAGKEFESLTAASNHYKCPEMKIALLQIELNQEESAPVIDYVQEAKDCIERLEGYITSNNAMIAKPWVNEGHKQSLRNANNAHQEMINKLKADYLK